jgi:20S proteasome alpha/beta subunit
VKIAALGKNHQAALTELEKVVDKLDTLDMHTMVREAVRALIS